MSQRSHLRVYGAVTCEFELGERTMRCLTRNLGMGGLLVLIDEKSNVGREFDMKVSFQGYDATVKTRVNHIQPDGWGLTYVQPQTDFLKFMEFCLGELLLGGAQFDELRSGPRVPTEERTYWRQDSIQHDAVLGDVSLEGAFVVGEPKPEVGQKIFVYLPASPSPQSPPTEIRGADAEVRNHREDGFGVRFLRPSAEFRMAIAQLMLKRRQTSGT